MARPRRDARSVRLGPGVCLKVTSPLTEPIAITLELADDFRELGVRYCVGGSLASSLHGIPRATNDVDIVVELKESHVDPFILRLENRFYVPLESLRRAVRTHDAFNLVHLATMLKMDLFVAGNNELNASELERSHRYDVGDGREIVLASAEDTIIQKLRWYKRGNEVSSQQWRDVLGILRVRGEDLDREYVRKWCARLNLSDLLERVLQEAGDHS